MRTNSQLSSKVVRGLSKILGQEFVTFWLEQAGSTHSTDRCLAQVVRIDRETADAVSLWLRPNALFAGFEAGQHVNLSVTIDGVVHTRSYSFSNAPTEGGLLRLTIKQTPTGLVSRYAVNQLEVGTVVELGDAFGEMTLAVTQPNLQPNLTEQRPTMLLLAAGSGITPMISLIEQLEARGWPADVTLMSWARNPEDVLFDSTLKAKTNEHFRYVRLLESSANVAEGDLAGRPSAEQFAAVAGSLDNTDVYACGPDGFMTALRGILGDTPKSFHAESFTPMALNVDENAEVKTFTVTLSKSNRIVEVSNNKPLLKALQEQGINPPHGCGMGICNTCSCEKLTGTTQNMQNKSVCGTNNTALRLCINAAQGPVSLDL
ncbi:ferredoxin reductase [Limnobacter sp.]|uniref:ferredoxin reductase n=1 Tax=Limnobacter sp. TaxID=2003368 RepID=UPI002FE0C5E4